MHNKYTHHHLVVCSVSVQQYYHNPLPYWYVWWSVCVLLNNRKTVFSMHLANWSANKNTRVWFVVLPGNRVNCLTQGIQKSQPNTTRISIRFASVSLFTSLAEAKNNKPKSRSTRTNRRLERSYGTAYWVYVERNSRRTTDHTRFSRFTNLPKHTVRNSSWPERSTRPHRKSRLFGGKKPANFVTIAKCFLGSVIHTSTIRWKFSL